MLLPGKPSVVKIVKRQMRLPMLGGMLQKPTNRLINRIVGQFVLGDSMGVYANLHSKLVAVQAFSQTVTYLTKAGRFRQAADREKDIAQINLQRGDIARACESYERAGEWYQQEDANAYVISIIRIKFLGIYSTMTGWQTVASKMLLICMHRLISLDKQLLAMNKLQISL